MTRRSGSIRRKMTKGMLIQGAVLIVAVCIIGYLQSYNRYVERLEDQAYAYSGTAAGLIDGDRVLEYLEDREIDDYYLTIQRFLDTSVKETEILGYSVYVPGDDHVVFVWYSSEYADTGDMLLLGTEGFYFPGEEKALDIVFRADFQEVLFYSYDEELGRLAVAMSPIFNSKNEPVAIAGVEMSMKNVTERVALVTWGLLLTALIIILSLVLYQTFMANTIVKPINQLSDAAADLVKNLKSGSSFESNIHTGDEIEKLARSFEQMDGELRNYITENAAITAERERIGTELSLAARIQADMLPVDFPAFRQVDIYASMTPAKEVGGDFYDFFLIDETHLGLVMADVSGKGIPAALFMMRSMILIRNIARDGISPKNVLAEVNEELCSSNEEKMFVTVWFGILDLESGKLTASNGGHEYPFIKKPGGSYEIFKDKHGLVLGAMDGVPYSEYEMMLEPGSSLFVYTDGVPEASDSEDRLFGMDRTLLALNKEPDAGSEKILANVDAAVAEFVNGAPQFDDLTMMCVQYKGDPGKADGS